jgi:hypothetical protein
MDVSNPSRIPFNRHFEAALKRYEFLDSERAFAKFLGHFYNTLSLYFQEYWCQPFCSDTYTSVLRFYSMDIGIGHAAVDKFVSDFRATETIFSQFENEYTFVMELIKGGFWDGVSIVIELKEKCLLYEDINSGDYFYPLTSLGLHGQALFDLMRAGKHIIEKFSPEKFSKLLEKLKEIVYNDIYNRSKMSHMDFIKGFVALYVLQKAYYQNDSVPFKHTNEIEPKAKSKIDVPIAKPTKRENLKQLPSNQSNLPVSKTRGIRTATKFVNLELKRQQNIFDDHTMMTSSELMNAIKLSEQENQKLSNHQGQLLKELEDQFLQLRQQARNYRELFEFMENTHGLIWKMSELKS